MTKEVKPLYCSMCEKGFVEKDKVYEFRTLERILKLHKFCYEKRLKLSKQCAKLEE